MDNDAEQTRKKKQGSPRFPGISLESAISRAAVVWQREGKHPCRMEVLAKAWDYSPKSSATRTVVAALGYYGLMDAGRAGSGEYQLSERALQILVGTDGEKKDGIKKSALEPKLYRAIWHRFGGDLPSDDNLKSRLILDYDFNRDSIGSFLKDFRATIRFANLAKGDNLTGEPELGSEEDDADDASQPVFDEPITESSAGTESGLSRKQQINEQPATKMIGTYSTLLGQSDVTLTFTGRQLVPDDLDGLIEYAGFLKKGLERRLKAEEQHYNFPVQATWRNKDSDQPVVVTGVMGRDETSGELYFRTEGGAGVPRSELTFK